jgi:hypothetical protein
MKRSVHNYLSDRAKVPWELFLLNVEPPGPTGVAAGFDTRGAIRPPLKLACVAVRKFYIGNLVRPHTRERDRERRFSSRASGDSSSAIVRIMQQH